MMAANGQVAQAANVRAGEAQYNQIALNLRAHCARS
jgi:hypothetical protein